MRALLCWTGLAAALALLAWLTYGPTIDAPFLFDDFEGIVRNPNVQALRAGEGPRTGADWREALTAPAGTGASGRPLVALSLAVDHARGGLDPRTFRETNLIVLFLVAISLAFLAYRSAPKLRGTRLWLAAFFTAALWIVHPLHGSAIHQVIYRGELMMTLAFVTSVLFAQLGFESTRGSRCWLASSVLCCALGMLSKENMFAAPVVCLIWDRIQDEERGLLTCLRERPVYYASLAGTWLLLAAAWISGDRGEAVGLGARGISSASYLSTQASVLAGYARWTFAPVDLAFEYSDWPMAKSLLDNLLAGICVLALLGLCLERTARRSRLGLAGLAGFLVLAPTSTIFPIAVSIAAEHRMTLPLAAVTATVAFGAMRLPFVKAQAGSILGSAVLMGLTAALCLGARTRNALFSTPQALWSRTVEERPTNLLARSHLVEELRKSGQTEEALRETDASLKIDAQQAELQWNRGLILASLGRTEESDAALRSALSQDESLAARQMHEAMRAWSENRVVDALHQLRICLGLKPDLAGRERLGPISLQAARAFAVAAEDSLFEPALALDITTHLPQEDLRVLEARATALAALDRFGEARDVLDRALARAQRNSRAEARLLRLAKLFQAARFERRAVTR